MVDIGFLTHNLQGKVKNPNILTIVRSTSTSWWRQSSYQLVIVKSLGVKNKVTSIKSQQKKRQTVMFLSLGTGSRSWGLSLSRAGGFVSDPIHNESKQEGYSVTLPWGLDNTIGQGSSRYTSVFCMTEITHPPAAEPLNSAAFPDS